MLWRNAGGHHRRQTAQLAHSCSSTEHWHALVFSCETSIFLPDNRVRKLFRQTSHVNRERSRSTPNNHVTGAVPNTDAEYARQDNIERVMYEVGGIYYLRGIRFLMRCPYAPISRLSPLRIGIFRVIHRKAYR